MRPSGRAPDQLRPISLEPGFSRYAEGSCLVKFGDTHVLCTASRRGKRAALPAQHAARAGSPPNTACCRARPIPARDREAARGKQSGRTQEIQRLIGRSLRAVVDLARPGRATDHHRLRRAAGRRRHPHRLHHRRLGRPALRLRAPDARKASSPPTRSPDQVAAVSCGLVGGHAGARPRLPGGFQGRRPTPISC